jgi:hypothetical protein
METPVTMAEVEDTGEHGKAVNISLWVENQRVDKPPKRKLEKNLVEKRPQRSRKQKEKGGGEKKKGREKEGCFPSMAV